jgi:lauroyl/myristoyl acyltransferase
MKYSTKHVTEYALLRSVGAIVNILPYRGALAFGAGVAWLAHYVFQFRVKETKRRIKLVFGDKYSDGEIAGIAWVSWRNIVFNYVEMLRIAKADVEWVGEHYDAEEFLTEVKKHSDTGKGGIIATPHMGNWDLASAPCCQKGLPVFSIAAKQRNPLTNDFFNKVRNIPGLETLIRGGSTMKGVVDKLNDGKLLVILPDSRMRTPDMELPFLGGKANLGKGMAFFARKSDVPIFPTVCSRTGWTKHSLKYFPPVYPDASLDKKQDIERMTRLLIEIADKAIREAPEQWFWYNSRWVLDPVE